MAIEASCSHQVLEKFRGFFNQKLYLACDFYLNDGKGWDWAGHKSEMSTELWRSNVPSDFELEENFGPEVPIGSV